MKDLRQNKEKDKDFRLQATDIRKKKNKGDKETRLIDFCTGKSEI